MNLGDNLCDFGFREVTKPFIGCTLRFVKKLFKKRTQKDSYWGGSLSLIIEMFKEFTPGEMVADTYISDFVACP